MNSAIVKDSESVSLSSLPFPMDADADHPWLLISQGNTLETHTLYNLSKNKHLQMNISEFRNKQVIQTSYGWLVLINCAISPRECFLINISSKDTIQLPSIELSGSFDCVLSKPPTDPDCHILFRPLHHKGFLFCRLGDDKYIKTEYPGDFICATINHNGKIIVWMARSRGFFEIDFVGGEPVFRQMVNDVGQPLRVLWPSPSRYFVSNYFFVESCEGDLLLVRLICKRLSDDVSHFRIYKVRDCSELTSIGDCSIFLGRGGESIMCWNNSGAESAIKNSIYYHWKGKVYVYDIEDRSITPITPCSIKKDQFLISWVMM